MARNSGTYCRSDPVNFIDPDGHDPTFSVTVWGHAPSSWQIWWFRDPPGEHRAVWSRVGVGRGGGGSGPLHFTPSEPDELQQRIDLLNSVLGENNKNVLDRIAGECSALIDAMIKQLQPSYEYPNSKDFISWHLNTAIQWNYFGAREIPGIGLHAGGWAYAYTKDDTIYLGERFFSSRQHDSILTIIHEVFHSKAVSANRDQNLTEQDLAEMANRAGYSGNSWQEIVSAECHRKRKRPN